MRIWLCLILAACTGRAAAATYPLPPPGEHIIGDVSHDVVGAEETLVDIARRNRLGYEEMALANPAVDRWIPPEGTSVLLPTRFILPRAPREGIVVNIAEYRLYYYRTPRKGSLVVETFAMSAGRDDWKTPNVATTISRKLKNPAWYPPLSIRREHRAEGRKLPGIVPPGPDNPLGPLALKLGIPGGYFIHGTSKAFGIGMPVTHGCLRLYADDMEALFKMVPEGTKVRVVNQPYKTGWKDGVLYLEAHPPPPADGAPDADLAAIRESLRAAVRRHPHYHIDWTWVEDLARQPRGVPLPVRRRWAERAESPAVREAS